MYLSKSAKISNRLVKAIITNVTVLLFSSSLFALQQADWTVLIFVQAKNSLSSFAHKNFTDMATVGSNSNLNILVEWHQPKKQGVWRYKVGKGQMALDSCDPSKVTNGNSAQDLVDSMSWAVKKFPAKKYALILWNHGIGILDPSWGSSMHIISPKTVRKNSRIQVAGITKNLPRSAPKVLEKKGILFNEHTRTYMNNQELTKALRTIKTSVLGNRKIDLLGMDACLMAMVEVAYQVHDCADYLVGSQEVELAYGWNYSTTLSALASGKATAESAARSIVTSFERFYKNKIHFYTQSAIDLSKVDPLKQQLNSFGHKVFSCKELNKGKLVTQALRLARSRCLQFSASSYIDLHSFFTEFHKYLRYAYQKRAYKSVALKKEYDELSKAAVSTIGIVHKAVIANASGSYLARAKGLSIYFPTRFIDKSYAKTAFARDSNWYRLINSVLYGE